MCLFVYLERIPLMDHLRLSHAPGAVPRLVGLSLSLSLSRALSRALSLSLSLALSLSLSLSLARLSLSRCRFLSLSRFLALALAFARSLARSRSLCSMRTHARTLGNERSAWVELGVGWGWAVLTRLCSRVFCSWHHCSCPLCPLDHFFCYRMFFSGLLLTVLVLTAFCLRPRLSLSLSVPCPTSLPLHQFVAGLTTAENWANEPRT